jgi:hypothetical protein
VRPEDLSQGTVRRWWTPVLFAVLLWISVCVSLLGAASSAAAQGQAGPVGASGSESAAQGPERPPRSAVSEGPAAARPEGYSTRSHDQTPAVSQSEAHPTPSPQRLPQRDSQPYGGSGPPDSPRGDHLPRGPGNAAKMPPAPPAGGGPKGGAAGGLKPGPAARPTPSAPGSGAAAESAGPPASPPRREPSPPSKSPAAPAGPATPKNAVPTDAAPRSSDNAGQAPSDWLADDGGSPSEASRSFEPSTPAAPPARGAPPPPVVGETRHRGSVLAVTRDPAVAPKALHTGRARSGLEPVSAFDVAETRVATRLAVRAAGDTDRTPDGVVPQQTRTLGGMSTAGASAGSSSSSSASVLGLISGLLVLVLLHWSGVLLVRERWRRMVFLAPPEQPG